MLWKHSIKLPSTIFYFITDWHRSLAVRFYPIAHSLKQSLSPQKCFFSRKTQQLPVPMQSPEHKDYGCKTVNCSSLLQYHPFFSNQLRLVGEQVQLQFSQGIASQVFDEDFDVEYVTSPANDELDLKKGKKKTPDKNHYSLVDEYWAKAVVKRLKNVINFQDDNIVIVECNPDYGLLTRALLLRTKVEVLCIHYRKFSIHSELESLMKKRSFKKRLHVERGHIINLRMMLKKIGKLHGNNAQHIKIIGTTFTQSYHSRFVTLLSYDLGGLNHIYSLGHIDIFLFVPEYELQILGKTGHDTLFNKGSLRSALYKVFFNVNVLLKIPSEAFKGAGSGSHHYLIHLVPRPDVYKMCSPQHIPHLIMLLKELRKRRGQKVITGIQSFCTPTASALKEQGFTNDDNISDLTVEQIISIHQVILSMPNCLPLDLHDVENSAVYLP